ncbi:MAG: HD-GYP domain-containing protein, partial [Myxococcales bacterium]|nr:HD-GYP domain-containing protein [Myxococcales bacterium]
LTCRALLGLAEALEVRDGYTRAHSEAVADLVVRLGTHLDLAPHQVEELRLAALVHDIGKIGVPDDILLKPGALTPEERQVIERHPLLAARILGVLDGTQGVVELVLLHHEYPDGSGYPRGLAGADVPLSARILQVADVFSALTDERPYKPSREPKEALGILQEMAGRKLDASVVAALVRVLDEGTALPAPGPS